MKLVLGNNLSPSFRDYFNDLAASRADLSILPVKIDQYPSRESYAELLEDPAGEDVAILQTVSGDFSLSCMQLFQTVAGLKRYGAKSVTVAMPFAPFARQDKQAPGKLYPLAGADFPKMLKAMGADKIITADVHSKKAEQFYIDEFGAGNVTFLTNTGLFADDILQACGNAPANVVIGAPDGVNKPADSAQARARAITRLVHGLDENAVLTSKMFGIEKIHNGVNTTEVVGFTGDVKGKRAVVVDDMSDSGGTIKNACQALLQEGAVDTRAYLSHGLFSAAAIEKILNHRTGARPTVGCLVVTDSIPGLAEKLNALAANHPDIHKRVRILPTAPQFAAAILKRAI
jgi:ribose-phosphate pyrophosphokinase